jgi:hypothetical protein
MGRAFGILRLIWGVPNVLAPAIIPLIVVWTSVRATYVVLGLVALVSVALLARMWRRWSVPVAGDGAPATDTALPVTTATTIPVTDLEA